VSTPKARIRTAPLQFTEPAAIAAAVSIAYLILSPPTGDLAGALYRTGLFEHHGFVLWDGQWYAGHHTLGYSVLYGPLAALVGVRLLGALSAVAAATAFAALIRPRFGAQPARLAAAWFALGVSAWLATGRLTFELGIPLGLAAVVAARSRNAWAAGALGALTALASPVAGAFVAVAGAALVAAGRDRRREGAALLAALVPIGLLTLAFPEGGSEPFVASSFWPALLGLAALGWVVSNEHRELRAGIGLYALACVGVYALANPMGGNVVRLGALFGGPVAALVLARSRPRLLALLALPLLYSQLIAPAVDASRGWGDPSAQSAYYRPLLAFLGTASGGPFRTEIVFTREKWETYWVASRFALARGWERQLDVSDNPLFYGAPLTPASYRHWLDDNAVRFVALPDVALDASARAEARLVRRGLPYLVEAWSSRHWRVFAVTGPRAPASGPGRMSRLSVDGFALSVQRPGEFTISERFTPYWAVTRGAGCVSRGAGGWTHVTARSAGPLTVAIRFSPERVLSHGRRCS
jgi:hypothetical protein